MKYSHTFCYMLNYKNCVIIMLHQNFCSTYLFVYPVNKLLLLVRTDKLNKLENITSQTTLLSIEIIMFNERCCDKIIQVNYGGRCDDIIEMTEQ